MSATDLSPLCAEFEVKAYDLYHSEYADVCAHFGIEPDDSVPESTIRMAATLAKALRYIATQRETMVELRDVPPQTLSEVIAEMRTPHVCDECDEESCVCWAYDDSLPAPVDVHPGERRAVAHGRQLRAGR